MLDKLPILEAYAGVQVHMEQRGRKHIYHVDGKEWPSVTTRLDIMDKPWMTGYSRKLTKNTILDGLLAELEENGVNRNLKEWLLKHVEIHYKSLWKRKSTKEADEGTIAHELIADLLERERQAFPLDTRLCEWLREAHPAVATAVIQAFKFISDKRLEPIAAEQVVFHPDLEYAGTVDLIARDSDGRLVVVDWKRAKQMSDDYAYQVAGYAEAVSVLTGERTVLAWVVRLPQEVEGPEAIYDSKVVVDHKAAFATYMNAQILAVSKEVKVW